MTAALTLSVLPYERAILIVSARVDVGPVFVKAPGVRLHRLAVTQVHRCSASFDWGLVTVETRQCQGLLRNYELGVATIMNKTFNYSKVFAEFSFSSQLKFKNTLSVVSIFSVVSISSVVSLLIS